MAVFTVSGTPHADKTHTHIVEVLTWHRPSPPARSRTRCCHWSGSTPALRSLWAADHRSPRPPTRRTARTGSGRSRRRTRVFLHPTPGPSSQESPGKTERTHEVFFLYTVGSRISRNRQDRCSMLTLTFDLSRKGQMKFPWMNSASSSFYCHMINNYREAVTMLNMCKENRS